MTTQSIQKKMVTIVSVTLLALYDGMARLGCGLAGIDYESQ